MAITFEEFAKLFRTSMQITALSATGDPLAVDDLVQETLLILYRRWDHVDPSARRAYTRTVMYHLAALYKRARSRETLSQASAAPEPVSRQSVDESVVDRLVMEDALGRLGERQRNVVRLRYWEALSTAEISSALHIPVGTVRSDLTRAARRLREILQGGLHSLGATWHQPPLPTERKAIPLAALSRVVGGPRNVT
jgi:RNA polymerase sigma factor (sigma-70 family)